MFDRKRVGLGITLTDVVLRGKSALPTASELSDVDVAAKYVLQNIGCRDGDLREKRK